MQKLPFFGLFLVALFSLTPLAHAVTTDTMTMSPTTRVVRSSLTSTTPAATADKESARMAFKEKLAQVKDAKKQALVEKIDARIQETNTKRTQQMSAALDRLTIFLDSLASKTATLTPIPQNAQTDITAAQTAIATAKTAVATQQSKDYVITVTTDAGLRSAVATTLTQFRTDITATHAVVLKAKTAVLKVAQDLAKSEETNETPVPTAGTLAP